MDSFGVPKKVNRYLINALYSLTCGLPNFFVPFDNVMDEVRYQMRNLIPIANEEQVFKMALQNLCNVGVVKSRGNECALSSFGRINASRQEVLQTFPPKSKMKSEDQKTTNENRRKDSPKISGKHTLANPKKEMNKKKQSSAAKSIEDMCPICLINKSFLLKNVTPKCCSKAPQEKVKRSNFNAKDKLEEECDNIHLQSSSTLDCTVFESSKLADIEMQNEKIFHPRDHVGGLRNLSHCTISSRGSFPHVRVNKIDSPLQNSCFENVNTPKRLTQNKKKKFKSPLKSSNTSQVNRDDFIKRFYTCDVTPFYLN